MFTFLECFFSFPLNKFPTILRLAIPIFDQCSTYVETRWLVFTSKMFEKHLWKSDILSKDAGHRLSD